MVAVAPCTMSHANALVTSRSSAVAYAFLASFMRRRTIASFKSTLACMCIQNCGVVLKSRASRSAVSAVTPRLPRTSSFRRTS